MTVVALDGSGGDFAPHSTVGGAIRAAERGVDVVIVGDRARLDAEFAQAGGQPARVRVVHAADTIGMHEHVSLETQRRKESSIYVALELVKSGEAEALVSMGNTGAVLALALGVLGRLPGVQRPALAAVIPHAGAPRLVLDVGANTESKPSHLVQWAALGAAYMRTVVGVADPSVGLLNIGEEPSKGTQLTIDVHRALENSSIRFVGNIEGRDIALSDIDVVVTDGFTGNVSLKLIEGMVAAVLGEVRDAAQRSLRSRIGGLLMRPALREIRQRLDYRQYGGVPLLGLDGIVIVGHGRSDVEAVANGVGTAATGARQGMLQALAAAVSDDAAGGGEPGLPRDDGAGL